MGNQQPRQFAQAGGVTPEGVRVGAHSAIPNDVVPYTGPRHQYCFVNLEAMLSAKATFLSAPVITTNVAAYYPVISQPYNDGFILKQFQTIPGVQRQKGFGFHLAIPFQAILARPINVPPSHERWQLRVEKSFLQTQQVIKFFTTTARSVADTSDIYQKVNDVTSQGGRLVCVEITGHEQGPSFSQSFSGYQGIKGVDLFFNMPLHPNPTIYVYQAISVPVQFKVTGGIGARITVLTDFMAQFAAFLQKGWKLIEINFDTSQTTRAGFLQARASLNSIWFFEKESSKMNSEEPQWEGTIVEYEHKISSTFGGTRAKTNWDPVIIDMGQRGWELACLVESPEVYQIGFATAAMKVIMLFQRRIMRPVGPGGFVVPPQSGYAPPPGGYPPPPGGYPSPPGGYPPPPGGNAPPNAGYPQSSEAPPPAYPGSQGPPQDAPPPK